MRVLFAGGGTGGHINPALAIASIIQSHEPDAEFLFAGTPNGMEAKLVPQSGYQLATIQVAGFQRKPTVKNIKRNFQAAWYLAKSGKRARQIVNEFQPDIAIGTGGYVAGPVIRMAAKMGVPCAIHEQNAYPGVTNKMLSRNVDHVMLTVKEALDYMDFDCPYSITGLPVRAGITQKTKAEARRELGFDDNMCILSFGGSLGAGCINEVMEELIPWHVKNGMEINHIHGYGGMGRESFPAAMRAAGIPLRNERLRITEYIHDMDTCLAAADLVICRAGASTLAELEAAGKASILIPSPIVAGNHQLHNANVLGRAGAAIVIEQKNVTVAGMIHHVEELYENRQMVEEMSEQAASLAISDTPDRIYQVIETLMEKAGKPLKQPEPEEEPEEFEEPKEFVKVLTETPVETQVEEPVEEPVEELEETQEEVATEIETVTETTTEETEETVAETMEEETVEKEDTEKENDVEENKTEEP